MACPQIANAMLVLEATGAGYSQGGDYYSGRYSIVENKDARPLVLRKNKATDCSAAVALAVVLAGFPLNLETVNGVDFYTGNEWEKLKELKFTRHAYSYNSVQLGDILWRDGHTEVVTNVYPHRMTGARINEFGGIIGGKPGDQTNGEFATSPLSGGWTYVFRAPKTITPTPDGGIKVKPIFKKDKRATAGKSIAPKKHIYLCELANAKDTNATNILPMAGHFSLTSSLKVSGVPGESLVVRPMFVNIKTGKRDYGREDTITLPKTGVMSRQSAWLPTVGKDTVAYLMVKAADANTRPVVIKNLETKAFYYN